MSAPVLQDHQILWGELQLHGPTPADSAYDIKAMSVGSNFGNPVSLVEAVRSLAIDGALAARVGWDNRQFPVRIRVRANDGPTHAKVEAALVAQCLPDRPQPITWLPPLSNSAPAVFDVLVADMDRDTSDGWDEDEIQAGDRFWIITFTALPFVHPVDSTTIEALAPSPASPSTTVLDDGTSVTNWTKQVSISAGSSGPSSVSGAITAQAQIQNGLDYLRLVRTATTAMPTGQAYLYIDAQFGEGVGIHPFSVPGTVALQLDGVEYTPVMTSPTPGSSYTRYWYVAPSSFTTLVIRKDYQDSWSSSTTVYAHATISEIGASDTLGLASSTTRQQARQAVIYGAMPTRAALRLYDATPGVLGGHSLVYTSSNTIWTPPLRDWMTSPGGTVTADSTMVSGQRNPMGSATVYRIPANQLETGAYALLARIRCTAAGTLTWQARLVDSTGATTLGSAQVQSGSVAIPDSTALTTTGYHIFDIADRLQLPPVEVEDPSYLVEITLTGTANMTLDEAWLFCLDNGALTWVYDFGDGPGLNWIEVRSPELGAARPSVFGGIGDKGVGSICIDYKCLSFGAHRFDPGPLQVFTVTTTSLVSQCEVEYFKRYHSHPDDTDEPA